MTATITTMLRDESGATMVEYGLLLAFVALIALVGVKVLGVGLSAMFSGIAGSL